MINTPAAAREFVNSWTSEHSLRRATRQVTYAVEGLTRALAIECSYPHRYSLDTRNNTRETRRTLIAELFYNELTKEIV